MILEKPLNNLADVLFELLNNGSASIKEFDYMAGFRTRVSELVLDHLIPLSSITETDTNKHGNPYHYKRHFLAPEMKDFAKGIYIEINKNKSNKI